MLTIYHAPGTRSLRVIWLCEELGLPYTVKTIDFSPAFRASPQWRALNPVGKVPVMTDGDFAMFESGAMVQYLLDRYGEGRLQPQPGSEAHGIYLQWSWFAESTYARPIGEIVNHGRAFGEAGRIAAVVDEMSARARLSSEAVDRAVSNRQYLLGDEFSAADIMMGYTIMIAEKFASIEGLESLNAYWQRLKARPAYQRAVAA